MKTKKPNERLDTLCTCNRCSAAVIGGGRAARSSARLRDSDVRVFVGMEQERAEKAVRLIAQHGVAWIVEHGPLPMGVATLLAYHSGAVLMGNARPRTCVLVRPKGYATEWVESVDAARDALKTPKHRPAAEPAEDCQLPLFGAP